MAIFDLMNTITAIFVLMVVAQFKHFTADFVLQGKYQLGKFKGGTAWILPLTLHAGIQASFTFVIATVFFAIQNQTEMVADWHWRTIALVTAIDFVLHFTMDRIKASPNMLGRYKALSAREFPTATVEQQNDNRKFWLALGGDQCFHHLTDIGIVYILTVLSH